MLVARARSRLAVQVAPADEVPGGPPAGRLRRRTLGVPRPSPGCR